MKKEDLDGILTAMLRSAEKRVSDFVFVTGKPPQIEQDGVLCPLEMEGPDAVLQPDHVEQMAELLISGDQRLLSDFEQNGSCDSSYALTNLARFRVNIYRQNGRRAIVMRRLESTVPSLTDLN
jgi:twitching motility protein PilT